MSNLLDDLGTMLADAGVGFYSATDPLPDDQVPIAILGEPETTGPAVTLATYAGPEPDTRNGWEYPRLQVRVRHADALAAGDLERTVYAALQAAPGTYPRTLTGWVLQDCYALQSDAQLLGRDSTGRWDLVRTYQLTCWPTT